MIRGIIFDVNGTLIDILTDEYQDELYRITAQFLGYNGVRIDPVTLRERYFALNREQRRSSAEVFPEFDVVKIFHDIIAEFSETDEVVAGRLALAAAQLYRAASLKQLQLYPGVAEILTEFQNRYLLAAVSDGQSAWALPELEMAGLKNFFQTVIVSGDFGFRKPDRRMFELALQEINLTVQETILVGNDMFRDIYGAKEAGLRTVFFRSNQGDWNCDRAKADYIIYDFRELPAAIEFLNC